MKQSFLVLGMAILLFVSACRKKEAGVPLLTLNYKTPAKKWTEALPIGNGTLGAMIYGDALNEHFQLNENTLYSGEPSSTFKDVDIRNDLESVIRMLKKGDYVIADQHVTKNWLGKLHQSYQPFGDLKMNFEGGEILNYSRELDISNSISTVSYQSNGVNYKREAISSYPDKVIAIKISADKKSSISFETFLESVHPNCQTKISGNQIVFKGQAPGFVTRRTLEYFEQKGDQHKYSELYDENGERRSFAKQVRYGDEVDGKGMLFEGRLEVRNNGGE